MEISKSDAERYQKEIQEGISIFQKGFDGVKDTTSFPEKKMEFEKSTGEALQAIQDAASALANKEILAQKDKLQDDYQNYLDSPTSENSNKVQDDIQALKDSAKG